MKNAYKILTILILLEGLCIHVAAAELLTKEGFSVTGKASPVYVSPLVSPESRSVDIEVDITGAKTLFLVVTEGGDGYGCDHADWWEPTLTGSAGTKKLTDVELKFGSAGWGNIEVRKGKHDVKLNGQQAEYGIRAHAASIIMYDLSEGFDRFKAKGIIDDSGIQAGGGRAGSSTVQFLVFTEAPDPGQQEILKITSLNGFLAGRAYAKQVENIKFSSDRVKDEFLDLIFDLNMRSYNKYNTAFDAPKRMEQAYDKNAVLLETDRDPVDIVIRRTEALCKDLDPEGKKKYSSRVAELAAVSASGDPSNLEERIKLFEEIIRIRRVVAFSNPLVKNMKRLLFITREALPADEFGYGNHMCDQYYGFHATLHGQTKGDGLYVLEDPFSDNPKVVNVLENSVVENGRMKGQKLDRGGFLSPDLSYDGKQILFAWTDAEPQIRVWNEQTAFHIFKVNVDGTHLVQLTDGSVNDFDPCWLPNGRIVFISERRGGFGRCHGRPVPSYTLHSMLDDGTDIVRFSPHETNEWHPSVDHNGMIIYTRWDYVDRGFNQAHHAWITYPDGRDSRAINGNTHVSERSAPHMEMEVRAIPGSHRYIATASGHHTEARGSLIMIDPRIPDDDSMAQITRLTPDQLMPEAEFYHSRGSGMYASPWPLSEKYILCVYDHDANAQYGPIKDRERNYGIYLVDVYGNKEFIFRNQQISCLSPIPLEPRKMPPVIPHQTAVGLPRLPNGDKPEVVPPENLSRTAEVGVMNVYNSLRPYPEGVRITHLRIWQVLPKSTPIADSPKIGMGAQKPAKAVLGIVPVEDDGSAFWNQPVGIPVLYHALDENGMAVQGMRSATYVQPGERLMCNGCHEPRVTTSKSQIFPKAMKRKASDIYPEFDGTKPFSYPRLIQPVLDRNCVECHAKSDDKKAIDLAKGDYEKNQNMWYTSFNNLRPFVKFYDNASFTESNTFPGKFGAHASKLYEILTAEKGHYDLKLSKEDMLKLTIWMDSNCLFYGHENDIKAQAAGEVVFASYE